MTATVTTPQKVTSSRPSRKVPRGYTRLRVEQVVVGVLRWLTIGLVLLACAGLGGCAEVVPSMPGPLPTDLVPSEVPRPAPTTAGNLSPDGFDAAQRMAVRIRNVGCGSVSTGSGFAIDAQTLITNRHVVDQSAELQLSTYDGRDIAATTASTAALDATCW